VQSWLDQSFPYGNDVEKFTGAILFWAQRYTPSAVQRAVTCALEHFTAILAHLLLRNQHEFVAESDPAFAALWLWHAVEEAKHKAVCFDVYQQVMGKGPLSYLVRIGTMITSTLSFLMTLLVAVRMINKPETERQKGLPSASGAAPAVENAIAKTSRWRLLRELLSLQLNLDYYRPSFSSLERGQH
jgi:uncharacterized protein